MKLYVFIAQNLGRIERLRKDGRLDYVLKIKDDLEGFVRSRMPRGSGFDSGTTLDFDKSTPDKLVFNTSFHHMNDGGFYDGWTEHQIIVTPSLEFDFHLRVTGRDRNQIKDYIAETVHHILSSNEDFKFVL